MMTRPKTLSPSNSRNKGSEENSEPIPLDLIVKILMKLPVNSIARFRCVSKIWYSILCSPNFTKSFLTLSSSRPKLLFICYKDGKTFFFTSPQPQNTSILTPDFHMSLPISTLTFEMCHPVRGVVCFLNQQETLNGDTVTVPLICNPSTGQSLALPGVNSGRAKVITYNYFITYLGYDPVNAKFKVLCMSISSISKEHQVLTLGTEKELSWRTIKCDVPHFPSVTEKVHNHYAYNYICINGFLYYFSWVMGEVMHQIYCFEIVSEKFKCIRKAQGMGSISQSVLVNYKGKLAMLNPSIVNDGTRTGIQLWVLEDTKNHQWSSYFYILPSPWKILFEENKLNFVGMTSTGEIVLAPNTKSDSFYLLYYNTERNIITKVEVQGMEAFKPHKAQIFLNHVEDVKLITSV